MNESLIELRLWQQFTTLAEELHFGRAAMRLHMTQPPLTQAVAGLERRLGVRLFNRTKRSVQLTAAGEALLPQARDLLARAQALPAQARAVAQGKSGRLRLAFVSTAGFALLPHWIQAFRAQYPNVQLDLTEATGDTQIEALAREEIDAGFVLNSPGFAPPGLRCLRVGRESLTLALPQQHPLASANRLLLSAVLAQPLVIFPRHVLPSVHDALFSLYHAHGVTPRIAQEAVQMQTIVNLVSAGLGVAWVPDSVRHFQRPAVTYRQLGGRQAAAVPDCETNLIWAAGNPVVELFVGFVRERLPGAPA